MLLILLMLFLLCPHLGLAGQDGPETFSRQLLDDRRMLFLPLDRLYGVTDSEGSAEIDTRSYAIELLEAEEPMVRWLAAWMLRTLPAADVVGEMLEWLFEVGFDAESENIRPWLHVHDVDELRKVRRRQTTAAYVLFLFGNELSENQIDQIREARLAIRKRSEGDVHFTQAQPYLSRINSYIRALLGRREQGLTIAFGRSYSTTVWRTPQNHLGNRAKWFLAGPFHTVSVIKEEPGWLQIRDEESKKTGWVKSSEVYTR